MLIFDESAVCTPVFCREVTGETHVLLPAAPFTVVLASSGRAAASAGVPHGSVRSPPADGAG